MSTHTISLIFFIATLLLSACSLPKHKPASDEGWTVCEDPRPQICTLEYLPVCGQDQEGKYKTYATDCTACSHAKVVSYRAGGCE